ncbi:aromatic amino acid lyase [Patescibacteria group bacterium]|nr:aromatic amino acid lyase [Patescibacteria group bacterium]
MSKQNTVTIFPPRVDRKGKTSPLNEMITIPEVGLVAENRCTVVLSEETKQNVYASNVKYMLARLTQRIYGDHLSYGARVFQAVHPNRHKEKQGCLIKSLHCGTGENLLHKCVRAAAFARLLVLSQGFSGVRPEILETFCAMINKDELPEVPSIGSIGASGDLVPTSHIVMEFLRRVTLEGREGLAIVNGTSFMTGIASLVVEDFKSLYDFNCKLFAILFQCQEGIEDVFDEDLHSLKRHAEQQKVAKDFRTLLQGSECLRNLDKLTVLTDEPSAIIEPIQDRYSLRCLPQELGVIEHVINDARTMVENELNSVSDNPIIIGDKIKHGGHFDGAFMAHAMEILKSQCFKLAYIMRAYMRSTTDSKLNAGLLPMYLVANEPEINNGLQGLTLSFDATYVTLARETISCSIFALTDHEGANQDVVSMGMHSALSALRMIQYLATLSAELAIITRQAVEMLGIENKLSPQTLSVYERLKEIIPFVDEDRPLNHDIARVENVLKDLSKL